jgi:hypothetical protein
MRSVCGESNQEQTKGDLGTRGDKWVVSGKSTGTLASRRAVSRRKRLGGSCAEKAHCMQNIYGLISYGYSVNCIFSYINIM